MILICWVKPDKFIVDKIEMETKPENMPTQPMRVWLTLKKELWFI
jgi:hypothetical protein